MSNIKYVSNAEWDKDVYTNEYGTHISTDEHDSFETAYAICKMLKRDGFGGMGNDFPKRAWVSRILSKSIVLEIAEYQGKRHKGFGDEYDRVYQFTFR